MLGPVSDLWSVLRVRVMVRVRVVTRLHAQPGGVHARAFALAARSSRGLVLPGGRGGVCVYVCVCVCVSGMCAYFELESGLQLRLDLRLGIHVVEGCSDRWGGDCGYARVMVRATVGFTSLKDTVIGSYYVYRYVHG